MDSSETDVTFRPLDDAHLPELHLWLNDPSVVEWWEGQDVSWEAVVRDYGAPRKGIAEHWLAFLNGEPFGWIQCYPANLAQHAETPLWSDFLDLKRTGGIDYLIGSVKNRDRGLGSRMIRTFTSEIAFGRHLDWDHVAAGPFEANLPSCRALKNAGFQRLASLNDPDGPCSLMVINRQQQQKRS